LSVKLEARPLTTLLLPVTAAAAAGAGKGLTKLLLLVTPAANAGAGAAKGLTKLLLLFATAAGAGTGWEHCAVFISSCSTSQDGGSGTPSMGSGGHRWRARVCRSTWNYSAPQAACH
jgi:hypothetical protein